MPRKGKLPPEEKRQRQRAACARWRQRYPERAKTSTDNWRAQNKDRVRTTFTVWAIKNKDKRKAKRDADKEKRAVRTRAWLAANAARNLETKRQWRLAHPEKKRLYRHARRARKREARGCASIKQIQARIDLYGGMCAWCGTKPYEHIDHVIALACGGTNWPANLRPSCRRCNQKKNKHDWSKRKPIFP